MQFTDKHVLITGGSSGIGLATAKELAKLGAKISLIARDATKLEQAASELKSMTTVATAQADVADKEQVKQAVDKVVAELGPIDILITAAGMAHPGYFENLDDKIFEETMQTNYFGTLYTIRAVAPSMMQRKNGTIAAISSTAGIIGVFGYTAYSPAKFAIHGLMECLHQELKPYNINISVICPPDTDTPQLAYENQFKPLETKLISGAIKPITAEQMAKSIVLGLQNKRFMITADMQTKLLSVIGSLIKPMVISDFNKKVAKARKQRGIS